MMGFSSTQRVKSAWILVLMTAVCVQAPAQPLDFSAWRTDHGEWFEAGSAFMDPDQPQRLGVLPGKGVLVNGDGVTDHLITRRAFDDIRLHVEFLIPEGSNSGVYFMGRYEIQIRDSYQKDSQYAGNECGGIYERWDEARRPPGFEGVSPRLEAARPPGQWQWFDVVFRAPRFDANGRKIRNARFERVYHNGCLIHENVEVSGPTRAALYEDEQPRGPIMLQGDHGPVAYRNLRVVPADQPEFFAMDTGTRDDAHRTFAQQAAMLKELGYDGTDHTGVENLREKLAALDRYGLRLFAVYLDVWADPDRQSYNEGLEQAIELLKGRDVTLWAPIRSRTFESSDPAGDEAAIRVIRRLADAAAPAGLRIALYPHSFFLMEKLGDAVRIAEKVDRPNVGVTFNLCHWLRTDRRDLATALREAAPYLRLVTINGADHEGDWRELIQPLDAGRFDVEQVLDALQRIGYSGPIGLQGYGIGGDAYENLRRSMKAWEKLQMRSSSPSR